MVTTTVAAIVMLMGLVPIVLAAAQEYVADRKWEVAYREDLNEAVYRAWVREQYMLDAIKDKKPVSTKPVTQVKRESCGPDLMRRVR